MRTVHIALVHYPVLARDGSPSTSAITNLDIHDLARSARTYGCASYFLIHPIAAQRELVRKVCEHWTVGSSAERIPSRKLALALCTPTESLDSMIAALGGRDAIELWGTAARANRPVQSFPDARAQLQQPGKPVVLLFGTAWGLAESVFASFDAQLPPLHAAADTGFRHLSVRAACAITLDRLLG
jgi:hypothetical protein